MRLVSIFLLLLPMSSPAHLPALYGWEFLRTQQDPPEVSPDCRPEPDTGLPGDEGYREYIAVQELQYGPYGEGLAEPLADRGRYQRSRGDHEEAVDSFRQALHLVRINHGLHSEQQSPLLDELVRTYRLLGNYQAVDAIHAQKLVVSGGRERYSTEGEMEAGLEYLRWQREAYGLRFDGNGRQRLLQAYLFNERMLESSRRIEEQRSRRELIYSQLSNLYLIMGDRYLQTGGESVGSSTELHPSQVGSPSYVRRRLAAIQNEGVDVGADLLRELISSGKAGDPLASATVRLELGDWYQWNGETRRALIEYATVDRSLEEAGRPELLSRWLGEPRELPDNPRFQQYGFVSTGTEAGSVTLQFQVSAKGQVGDIEIVAGEDEAQGHSARIKRLLAETHFRPRIVDGQAELAAKVQRQYQLIADPGRYPPECAES